MTPGTSAPALEHLQRAKADLASLVAAREKLQTHVAEARERLDAARKARATVDEQKQLSTSHRGLLDILDATERDIDAAESELHAAQVAADREQLVDSLRGVAATIEEQRRRIDEAMAALFPAVAPHAARVRAASAEWKHAFGLYTDALEKEEAISAREAGRSPRGLDEVLSDPAVVEALHARLAEAGVDPAVFGPHPARQRWFEVDRIQSPWKSVAIPITQYATPTPALLDVAGQVDSWAPFEMPSLARAVVAAVLAGRLNERGEPGSKDGAS